MKVLTFKFVVILLVTGCSNKDLYNNIQNNGKKLCENEPPAHYDECMAQYSESYEDYKNSRDKLMNDAERNIP